MRSTHLQMSPINATFWRLCQLRHGRLGVRRMRSLVRAHRAVLSGQLATFNHTHAIGLQLLPFSSQLSEFLRAWKDLLRDRYAVRL